MKVIEIKKAYDSVAKRYNGLAFADKYRAYKKLAELGLKYYKKKEAKVLDLGCGTGLSSIEFFRRCFEIIGIDISNGMLNEAKKYPYKRLICQDLEKPLKVADNYFDIVILAGVMEFIENPLKLFLEIKSKLKKEGIFLLSIPKRYPVDSYLRKRLHRKSYDKREIEDIFDKSRFKIIKRKEVFGYYKQIDNRREKSYFYLYILKKR
jgi:predicted TPR repeat methyltransferase